MSNHYDDIIPITYCGGTGGNFLCHFIVSAKYNIKEYLPLSKHGNVHDGMKDIYGPKLGLKSSDIEKINFLLDKKNLVDTATKPYYAIAHLVDTKIIEQHFTRYIRITYDEDDIDEISKIFFMKCYVDNNIAESNSAQKKYKMILSLWKNNFIQEKNSNALYISWKELYKESSSKVISKLSNFTNIQKEKFSETMLEQWRIKTTESIQIFSGLKKD